MPTVQELLRRGAGLAGGSPRRDAEVLLGHCLAKSRTWLYAWPEREVGDEVVSLYTELLKRRENGEPVAHLTGEREFWSLSLAVDNSTLIPRPETEELVAWALELPLPADALALDLGTGTGAIALAVASERPGWQVSGVDSSVDAIALAERNAESTGLARVSFSQSDWFGAVQGQRYHLLMSNPPYIDTDDPHLEQGDVRFEPHSALVAGDDGLADIESIIRRGSDYLLPGGWLLLEHGFTQGEAVRELLSRFGYEDVATRADLAGHERVTGGRIAGGPSC